MQQFTAPVRPKTAGWFLPAVVSAVVMLALASCSDDGKTKGESAATQAAPETTFHALDRTHQPTPHPIVPQLVQQFCNRQGWGMCDIWEYTDQQRLNDGSGQYGPVGLIIPAQDLETFSQAMFTSAGGAAAANVFIDTTLAAVLPPSYQKLKLSGGNNCVYLKLVVPNSWIAYIAKPAATGTPCPATHDMSRNLKVYPVAAHVGGPNSPLLPVPAVARFHEGKLGPQPQPLLGVKCLDRWCMILPPNPGGIIADTIPLPQFTGLPQNSPSWKVHGWHDVQHLSVPTASGALQYSTVVAAIVPDVGASSSGASSFSNFEHAATVYVDSKIAGTKYETRWHFKQGPNKIFIKRDPTKPTGWSGKSQRPGLTPGSIEEFEVGVDRYPHSWPVPAAARFWWNPDDEGLWVRCDDGCCKVSES